MDELLSGIKKEEKKHAICDNMDLEAIMLSEISQTGKENTIWSHLHNYTISGTSLVVQWLRLMQGPNAGDQGSIPSQGTRFFILKLRLDAVK